MRWRRRFASVPKKYHYADGVVDEFGYHKTYCKGDSGGRVRTTIDPFQVNCKVCLKKMIKAGIIRLDDIPVNLQPTMTTSKKVVVDDTNYETDYLRRLGMF